MSATLSLLKELIARPSITPDDAGCQLLIAERLQQHGFHHEDLSHQEVTNSWLLHSADGAAHHPVLMFAGHTDVVPAGDESKWHCDPFTASAKDGLLYGRGAADMKAGVAAMVVACENFIQRYPEHRGTLAMLLTSDEEGRALYGTRYAIDCLLEKETPIDYCIIGEPSCHKVLGDTVKHGRRGSLTGRLSILGTQGHVAYPDQADNPIHAVAPVLEELCAHHWDQGDENFPPSSFQFVDIHAGMGRDNVIPDRLEAVFNIRYSPALSADRIRQEIEQLLARHHANYKLQWHLAGQAFLSKQGYLRQALSDAIQQHTQQTPLFSTAGGTSDGRFIIASGAEILEFGPVNASIHQVNEHTRIADLQTLTDVYTTVIEKCLLGRS